MPKTMKARSTQPRLGSKLEFFRNFLRRPALVGSIIPSSHFLERRLINFSGIAQAKLAVELGPGTGGTMRAILDALPQDSKLVVIELNSKFVSLLKAHPDPRLIVYHGSAENIGEALSSNGLSSPDVVVSGIPFSTMPRQTGRGIISAVWSCLGPGGRFVAYQYRDRVALLGEELLGKPERELELLNVPPVRLYSWRK